MDMFEKLSAWRPQALAVLRIMTALLFIEHGTQKAFGFPAGGQGSGELSGLMMAAAALEIFGGLAILVGFLTRPVAFVLSGFMAVAYFMAHAPQSFYPVVNRGDAAILFCFVFLYLTAAGPGAWALDNRRA